MTNEIQIRAIEFDPETVQVVYVDEPRMSAGGRPVGHSHIITIDRGDDATAPLVEDLMTTLNDYVRDILEAVSTGNTRSLDEYESDLEDDELDLGMGDDREADV